MKRISLRSLIAGVACAAVALVAACSAKPPNLGDSDGSTQPPGPGTCSDGKQGCPCTTEGATAACGDVVRQSGDYVTCSEGNATCTNGKWGACAGDTIYMKSVGSTTLGGLETQGLQNNPTPCSTDPCDPSCTNYVDNGNGLDAGAGLQPSDSGGVTLVQNEGGACQGYQCQVASCGVNTPTKLTGTVYDPAGLNPVYHAYVYIPVSLPLPAIPSGAQQDPCGGGGNLPPSVAYAFTGPDGKFTLTGAPSGNNIPLVVQAGKWRRMVMLSSVNQCTTTAVPAANTRLPQNQTDGYNNQADLPQMAIVTGACDPMECLVKRIGVSSTEFKSPGTGGKVDYYEAYGTPLNGGTNPTPSALLNNYTQMMKEDLIMLPCDCGYEYYQWYGQPARWQGASYTSYLTNLKNYANAGGRLFTSHWGRQWIEGGGYTAPFPNVANWIYWGSDSGYDPPPSFEGQINTGFQTGTDFSTWMGLVGAQTTAGKFLVNASRYGTTSVTANSRLFVSYTGRYTYDNGASYYSGTPTGPADFTFDTPVGATNQYGRVMFTDMHLSSGQLTGSFPSECPSGALTPQEKAAEFLLFDLGACLTNLPPPPPAYYPATFTRDYQGVCPTGQSVVWRFFDWETHTPGDSSINFKAQTADTQALLATATPVVNLGTASGAPITNWTGTDVSAALSPNPSRAWLRVTISLNPTSDQSQAPTLDAWRQQFDCVDSQ